MGKTKIWIDDEVGGRFPVDVEIRRDGNKIVIENDTIKIIIYIDSIMSVLGDEGHG